MIDESRDDLLTTSDQILDDTVQLQRIEVEKRLLGPDDPRAGELSARAAEIGARIRAGTLAEQDIVAEIQREE